MIQQKLFDICILAFRTQQGKNIQTLKMQDGSWPHFEKSKVQFIRKVLTNFAEIWHDDASRPSEPHQPIKFSDYKNPRLQTAAILKIEKITHTHTTV